MKQRNTQEETKMKEQTKEIHKNKLNDTLTLYYIGFPSGIIRYNWNDTEKISMAPAQG